MLSIMGKDGIEDPTESKYGIDNHDEVIWPSTLERDDVTQQGVPRVALEKGEIHEQVPYRLNNNN